MHAAHPLLGRRTQCLGALKSTADLALLLGAAVVLAPLIDEQAARPGGAAFSVYDSPELVSAALFSVSPAPAGPAAGHCAARRGGTAQRIVPQATPPILRRAL
jgi:hypothetical protein